MSTSPELARLSEDLRAMFPQLHLAMPLSVLGSGFHSLAVETCNGIVFRVAKNREAAEGQAREAQLLPVLLSRVPLAVPDPRWHIGPCDRFPFGVIGYLKVSGTPLHPQSQHGANVFSLAPAIAKFLRALHGFPSEKALSLGVPGPTTFWERLELLRADVLPLLGNILTLQDSQKLARWWDSFLTDPELHCYAPCLCHGDLWYENILVDDAHRMVTGIVDFEDAVVGDPAQDFATLLYLGKSFISSLITVYQALGGTLPANFNHHVQRYWELRDFWGLQFAARYADQRELTDALCKLRQGPILNPGAHPQL